MFLIRVADGWYGVKAKYDPDLIPKFRALPGAQWDREQKLWRVSTADDDLLDLVRSLVDLGCTIPQELADRAKGMAGEVDELSDEAVERASDARLYEFQKVGVRWLAGRKAALLADEMGLGKTIESLMSIPSSASVLVVCPASLKGNWKNETRKWRPEFRVTILSGRSSFRWPEPNEMVIINYDILVDAPGNPLPETVLIADEVHLTKGISTNRTKRFQILTANVLQAGGRAWGLTGTPILNRANELEQILKNLHLFKRAFKDEKKFNWLFKSVRAHLDGWAKYGTLDDTTEEIKSRLERVMLRRERDQVLKDLPGKRWQTIPVVLDNEALREDMAESYERWEGKIAYIRKRDKLTDEQCKGIMPAFEDLSRVRAQIAEAKIPVLEELVAQHEQAGNPIIVFSAHRAPIEKLAQRFGWAMIAGGVSNEKRTEIVADFQAGTYKGIACTIRAGGMGITLTRASTAIFVDLDWTPGMNRQAEDRLNRIGQRQPCLYQTLVGDHALEERLAAILQEKTELIDATVTEMEKEGRRTSDMLANAKVGDAQASEQDEHFRNCPLCKELIEIWIAGDHTKNPGRRFVKCKDCDQFVWLDDLDRGSVETGQCSDCQAVNVIQISGPNAKQPGGKYFKCRFCQCFNWLGKSGVPQFKCPDCSESNVVRTAGPKSTRPGAEFIVCRKCKGFHWTGGSNDPSIRRVQPQVEKRSAESKVKLVGQLQYLLSVCDGAHTKDDRGFNGYDAPLARQHRFKVSKGTFDQWDNLEHMLNKYRKQLENAGCW